MPSACTCFCHTFRSTRTEYGRHSPSILLVRLALVHHQDLLFDIDARSRRLASSKAFPFELKARGSWQSVNRVLWDLGGIAFLLLMVAIRMGRDYLLVRGLIHLFSKNTLGRRCAALSTSDFDWPPQAPTKP